MTGFDGILGLGAVGFVAYALWMLIKQCQLRFGYYQKWKESREVLESELPSRLTDDVSKGSIVLFSHRAATWKRFADITFVFSLASVAIGVCVFIFADRIALNNPELPVLLKDRDTAASKIREIEDRSSLISQKDLHLKTALDDWNELVGLTRQASHLFVGDTRASVDKEQILATFNRFHSGIQTYKDRISRQESYDPVIVAEIADACRERELSIESWKGIVNSWIQLIETSMSDGVMSDDEVGEAILLRTRGKEVLEKSEGTLENLKKRQSEVSQEKIRQNATKQLEELNLAKLRHEKLQKEIEDVREKFDPNSLYSVIPLIVVRGGAVLLLIFLTQILLSAYRYNTMLSTHYSAIADAIRMAEPAMGRSGPSVDEFSRLLTALSPRDASYTLPDSPTQQIVDLLTKTQK